MMAKTAIIPLIIIMIISTSNKTHIGFDVAGIEEETSVRNIAYDSKIVIESDIRSPESTGRRNTSGFKRQNSSVGIIIVTI
jgi:hypothetical protein